MEDKLTENIVIDGKAAHQIVIACNQYKIIGIFFIINSVGSILLAVSRYLRFRDKVFSAWEDIFKFRIYPFCSFLVIICSAFQLYFIFTAIRYQKKALDINDMSLFNKSFGFYVKGNAFGIINLIMNIALVYLYIWQET